MTPSEVFTAFEHVLRFKLFEINQTPITASSLLVFCLFLAAFAIFSRVLQRLFAAQLFSRMTVDAGTQYTLNRIVHYAIMIIGSLVAFQFVGIDLTGLAVVFGFLSVGIGFGLQNITSNFVAGLILLFERPIKVGDRVTVADKEGDVVEIKIRSTTIRTLNNIAVIVPNSEFVSATVFNWSYGDQKVRLDIDVGVSYGSDLQTVLQSLRDVADEHAEVLENPAPEVLHMGFGDSAWNMRLRAWIAQPQRHPQIRSELNCAIVERFRRNGVEIPFPQRDLHLRSPLPIPHSSVT
ncbi:MAG: mechanosensitive ion channel [Deltaproteobacteria bacterium]|nr:mechanosensitive ion channel [Deltaproteobacteria bacterium]